MAKHYYIRSDSEKGFEEISKEEWDGLMGEPPARGYAIGVYKEEITTEDVPEEYREAVADLVSAKVARWGLWKDRRISGEEFAEKVEEVL